MADLLARTVVVPAELPLGAVTVMVGGPFFLWLVHRTRRTGGACIDARIESERR